MPPMKRKAGVSATAATTASKRPRLSVLTPVKPQVKPPSSVPAPRKYPWDSHQDDIVVRSIEQEPVYGNLMGYIDYRHQIEMKRSYDFICTHPSEQLQKQSSPVSDHSSTNEEDDEEERAKQRHNSTHPEIDFETAPAPLGPRDFGESIYLTTSSNPAVFLAIVRIAQKNLPFMNFDSALNHLPNLGPQDPLPKLPRGTFVGDIPHMTTHLDDDILNVAVLPSFYADGRHAIGYFATTTTRCPRSVADVWHFSIGNALFAPCVAEDLEDWELVREGGDGNSVMAERKGRWLDYGTVEEYEDWASVVRVARGWWGDRMEFTMGKGEGGGRWKGVADAEEEEGREEA